ncbi:MAG: DMT family transporter [Rhodovibrionaceae bacterium]|nr:DMT family transporter [Rhodovibrionaceae bacterium]
MQPHAVERSEAAGLVLGFLGVACFSLTLPATIMALESFEPWLVAIGRATLAGIVAGGILLIARVPRPSRRDMATLVLAALGVVFGFPLFTSWAMQHVPAAHGGVVLGVLPLATAVAGALFGGERPSLGFWAAAVLGSAAVVAFSVMQGGGRVQPADLALVAAVISAAVGYALGGSLARRLGGWQTICWALVISMPALLPLTAWRLAVNPPQAPTAIALAGFLYVALGSQLFGFFAWYKGLGLGGVARVSQMQLLQPFLTILAGVLLLGEAFDAVTLIFAALVSGVVGVGRRMPVRRR